MIEQHVEAQHSPRFRFHGRRWLAIAVDVVAGLLVAAALVALVATQVMGYRVLGIASDSMVPTLQRGDLIVSRPVPITSVGHGDIVIFEEGQQTRLLVAHRVVNLITLNVNVTDSKTGAKHSEQSRILRTQGDANPLPDQQSVDAGRFHGVLLARIPGIGGLLGSSYTQLGLLVVALVMGLAWLGYEVVAKRRRRTAGQ